VSEVAAAIAGDLAGAVGIRQAEIVTARELGAGERGAGGRDRQAGRRARRGQLQAGQSILGGTVVRIGSTVYDGSVRGRLDRLKEAVVSDQWSERLNRRQRDFGI
jgi:F-type H+-transporting ATPase subunit delta